MSLVSQTRVLENPDFEQRLCKWDTKENTPHVSVETISGRPSAVISVGAEVEIGFVGIYQPVGVEPGDVLFGEVEILTRNIHDGVGAYLVLEYMGADGKRMNYASNPWAVGTADWFSYSIRSVVPDECHSHTPGRSSKSRRYIL